MSRKSSGAGRLASATTFGLVITPAKSPVGRYSSRSLRSVLASQICIGWKESGGRSQESGDDLEKDSELGLTYPGVTPRTPLGELTTVAAVVQAASRAAGKVWPW